MNYTVYKMNHLDNKSLPTDIDALIFLVRLKNARGT